MTSRSKEKELAEYRQRYYEGMRALSKEEMEALAISQAEGMRNSTMSGDQMRGMAQASNMWPHILAEEAFPDKPKPTRWQRVSAWWRDCFFNADR